ncbi:cysteine desulfurase family protein [Mesorhizobium sp. RIZ17]|uniref:cysteine desulfurase family protein n=1 Tax=Mesorhizobium sp. RIZ17 TaxID=3132743 RepID=UPI003DA8BECB
MPIYLDYHAHALIDPRVLAKMVEAFGTVDANPHSTHQHGIGAHSAVEDARDQVARVIHARPSEIIFTSGATEANNLAFFGLADHLKAMGRPRIAVSEIEHPSILEAAAALGSRGFEIDRLPVNGDGLLDMASLRRLLTDETGLVSVAWANHEIGVIQHMANISGVVRERGALLHSDLAQAAGKIVVPSALLDLASISAHKLGGPVGIGALYVARRLRSKMKAQSVGGGQEGGLRSGTVAAPLCVAFGEACSLAVIEMESEAARIARLRDRLIAALSQLPGATVNGSTNSRLPGNVHMRFDEVDGEALVIHLQDQLSISTGSACNARSLEPSHVLLAIGLSKRQAECAVRIGLGRTTTPEDIDATVMAITAAVGSLRATRSRA